MSIYGDNVVDIQGYNEARQVRKHMQESDYIQRKLSELASETDSLDLDDMTSRQIVKYQSRLLVTTLFEKIHVALGAMDAKTIKGASLRDLTGLIVGFAGRIDTLMKTIEGLTKQDGSEMDQFVARLRSMDRAEAFVYLREEFESVFGTLFTDEERAVLFRDLEEQVLLDKLGTEDDTNVRAAPSGEEVGSSRWVPKSGPAGVLPPPRGAT